MKIIKIIFFILIVIFPIIMDIVLIILSILVIPIMWLSDFDCSILKYYEEIPKNLLTTKLYKNYNLLNKIKKSMRNKVTFLWKE